jgi:hypothetical protein
MSRAVAYPVPAMMTMSHQFFIRSLMYGRSWLIEIRSEELLFESDMRLQFRYDLEKKAVPKQLFNAIHMVCSLESCFSLPSINFGT